MPNFDYIIRNESGSRKTGSLKAENYNEAVNKLQSDNNTVVKLSESDTSFDFIKPFINRLALETEKFKNKIPIIGVGGVHRPDDAIEKLNAGASLVQMYTGFIYEGPGIVKRINKALLIREKT